MALQRHCSNDFGFVVRNSGSHLTIHCHFAKFGSVHNCTMNAYLRPTGFLRILFCVGATSCATSRNIPKVDDLLKLDINNFNLREEMPRS